MSFVYVEKAMALSSAVESTQDERVLPLFFLECRPVCRVAFHGVNSFDDLQRLEVVRWRGVTEPQVYALG